MTRTPEPAAESPSAGPAAPVVIIGPMGAGKSSVGKRVAKALGVPFTDTDRVTKPMTYVLKTVECESVEG